MGLETATFINQLVDTNPTSSDNANQGDNHLRLIKSAVKNTFPNVAGAVTVTHDNLNSVVNRVAKAGDTMTGALTLSGAPTSDLHAATKAYVDIGLAGRAALSHTHAIGDIVNLQPALDSRLRFDISTQGLTEQQRINARTNLGITSTGTATNTDQIPEGTLNLYFTETRARNAFVAGSGISILNGVISATAANSVTSVAGKTGAVTLTISDISGLQTSLDGKLSTGATTTNIAEGTNQYFTTARARTSISASGSISYNSTTGVISFTDAVSSVAGKTGAVTLAIGDISNLQTSLDAKASTSALSSYLPLAGGTLSGGLTISSGNLTLSSGNISVTGAITASGDITAFSDARLKTSVETISEALYKVKALRGVSFTSKMDHRERIGVIAQEVERVVPEVVTTHEHGLKSVAYGNLVGLLIEAIKDLSNRVEELERR